MEDKIEKKSPKADDPITPKIINNFHPINHFIRLSFLRQCHLRIYTYTIVSIINVLQQFAIFFFVVVITCYV